MCEWAQGSNDGEKELADMSEIIYLTHTLEEHRAIRFSPAATFRPSFRFAAQWRRLLVNRRTTSGWIKSQSSVQHRLVTLAALPGPRKKASLLKVNISFPSNSDYEPVAF